MRVLIDADSLIYKSACPCETHMYCLYSEDGKEIMQFQYKQELIDFVSDEWHDSWGEDFLWVKLMTHIEPLENAIFNIDMYVNAIIEDTGAEEYALYLSKGDTFRHELHEEYKANRPRKPVYFDDLFDHLVKTYKALYVDGTEADDLVSADAYFMLESGKEYIIAHIDKDLDMIEGKHFNYNSFEDYYIDKNEALANFYRQLLIGDTTDNIKGVHGIGKVKASRLVTPLMTEQQMFEVVDDLYEGDRDRLLRNGQLLWMVRKFNGSEPVIWTLPDFVV